MVGDRGSPAFARLAAQAADLARVPEAHELRALVEAASAVLDSEAPGLRPRDRSGRPGGLLLLPERPTVLVPDLHARAGLLAAVFAWKAPGQSRPLAELLAAGEASLVCLGDVFHSEAAGARERWAIAYLEYVSGWATSASMDEEMGLSLSAASIVLAAKAAFPASFHYLKGNHDNIADEEGRGDHPFYKFAAEGEMVASWFVRRYGAQLLAAYREFELGLPLLALGDRFVASHGEPAFPLGREDAIECRSRPEIVEALIWTDNGEASEGSVAESMDALLGPEVARGARWFAGHRPVEGRYSLRAGGQFVQFHDPRSWRVAYLLPGRDPDPKRDILYLPRTSGG